MNARFVILAETTARSIQTARRNAQSAQSARWIIDCSNVEASQRTPRNVYNLCYNGQREECNPLNHQGCDNPAVLICDAATLTCKACVPGSNECARRDDRLADPDGKRVCSAGRCVVCSAATNQGCDADSNQPVCRPAETHSRGCSGDGPGNCGDQGSECLANGRCSGCDPDDNSGCPSESPRCAGDLPACGACANDGDCARFGGLLATVSASRVTRTDRSIFRMRGNERCCLDNSGTSGW